MEISAKRHFFTRDRDFYARFFRLLLFISLQNIITTSVSLADNIMLGRFSENALAGVAQVNQIQFLLQMIVNGAAEGMLVLNAQYWGRRDVGAIIKVIAFALPVMATGAFWGLAMMVQAAILGHLGVTATASSSVANSVFQIISVLCYAAASAGGSTSLYT